jgi:hypothetical protein
VTFTQTARNPLQVVWKADKLASTLQSHQVPSLKTLKLTAVIAGELEGSWLAGGQQEGLQYNGKAAG